MPQSQQQQISPRPAKMRLHVCISRLLLLLLSTVVLFISFVFLSGLTDLEHHHNPVATALDSFRKGTTAEGSEEASSTQSTVDFAALYPVEEPIENPTPADGYNTFAACMLVMDDNMRLAEWLAYHFHVLPLRYMIVVADPRSKTSPSYLWNRWRRQGMYIEEWKDTDFWRGDLRDIPDDAELQKKRDRHRGRQKFFYRSCLTALKKANRTWVALHDSDEYLVYNHAGGEKFEAWEEHMQQLHNEKRQELQIERPKESDFPARRTRPKHTPPTTAEPGAMIHYIRAEQAAGHPYYQSPCIGVPRLQFGAAESTKQERENQVPSPNLFDTRQFDTLRWRKHAERNNFVKNALGKVIMDISRIDIENSPYFMSLHRPIKKICTAPWHNDWESGLRINHYLGSWESYSFRDDSRKGGERSREQWEYKGSTNQEETDDNIRPWLSGFVKQHGTTTAQELLEGVGLPKGYKNVNDTAWTLLPDKLEKILTTDVTVANDNKRVAFDAWVRQKYGKERRKRLRQ